MIPEIICGAIGLILWEVFYLLMCKDSNEHLFESEWINYKMTSFVLAFIISGVCYGIYYACREAVFELLIVLLSIVVLGLFFYLNHEIGLYVCKNRNKKKRKTR